MDGEDGRVCVLEEDLLVRIRSGQGQPEGIEFCALGIGDNRQRLRTFQELEPLDVPVLIHPTASVSPTARFSRGTVVFLACGRERRGSLSRSA